MELNKDLKNGFIILDGAMGTMLQKEGMEAGELPETYNITQPDVIMKIHEAYAKAGADIITTNTFGANEFKLKSTCYTVKEVISSAVNLA